MSEIGIEVYGVAAIITFFGLVEMLMGVYGHRSVRSKNDWLVEVLSFGMLTVLDKAVHLSFGAFDSGPFDA
jgi:hypothetical protein